MLHAAYYSGTISIWTNKPTESQILNLSGPGLVDFRRSHVWRRYFFPESIYWDLKEGDYITRRTISQEFFDEITKEKRVIYVVFSETWEERPLQEWIPYLCDDCGIEPGDTLMVSHYDCPAQVMKTGITHRVDLPKIHPEKVIKIRAGK